MSLTTLLLLVIIGLLAGVLSGFVGVGGGLIIVPALVYIMGLSQHEAQGTSLGVLLLPVGILAVMNYYRSGQLDIRYALIIAAAFVAGGYFGSKWALVLPEVVVRRVFGFIMLIGALKLILSR
ncbi:MAG: sulfite exporter TauE/SafE family protein [Flavobacteriales bacterium]|nr:sulfite exporter TauE/SafE family protein [Flavobacteriales bacterium]MCB0818883.1 sulfite exporter TauE/SafE family protein [Flavobacteriales bacterium]MCB9181077.1 sulfite exporter TauE/SafE family protein [Flavobacteriales bacterium]MCB9199135.1 sulfite exporter TauE/SafE family protein [Flavobacteriales bacterium]HOP43953.1 sulfite exporter TauE/SafE family protein [Flavobacteriales bacterium]